MRGDVYWNIHRACWSFRDLRTRRVILHAETLTLRDCTFHVSEAGRQRVLREGRKNIHAVIRGTLTSDLITDGGRVRYNPYKTNSFTLGGKPVRNASMVGFGPKGYCIARVP